MTINNKIIVCYLFTKFDDLIDISNFINSYKKLSSGQNHLLIICLKLIDDNKQKTILNMLNENDIDFEFYKDNNLKNDFDFGSYYRIAKKFDDHLIFYLNASSRPETSNWLKLLVNEYEDNSLIGTTASYESHFSTIKLKKIYKILSYTYKKLINLIFFKPFPNPHIRTTGFLIYSKNYLEYYRNKNCKTKFDAWKLESGKNSLSNFFLKKKFTIKLINADGKSYDINNWAKSNTYCYLERSRIIISDKHTRKYDGLNSKEKLISRVSVWGV